MKGVKSLAPVLPGTMFLSAPFHFASVVPRRVRRKGRRTTEVLSRGRERGRAGRRDWKHNLEALHPFQVPLQLAR